MLRTLTKPRPNSLHHHHYWHRTFVDGPAVKRVRDRGLDHAVEREKNLKPLINIKNLIKSEPSKSLPISIITQQKDSLNIPIRPIDFVRRYPSVFQEFLPGNIGIHPHIKLTPEALNIDAEEQLVYESVSYKQIVADRLLKLLMISKINKLPLKLVDILKWDLGLPQDYTKSLVPEFPDYFRVVGSRDDEDCFFGSREIGDLELVCWSNELAISVMEKKAKDRENIVFSMKYSTGFEMDKEMKKWLDEWQKLPYISPYENASHLLSKSDESDKWAVAILHEVLSLFGAKKVEKDNVFCLGEYLGIRSRFKRALLNHPGIFYMSSKIGTYTVVLRDGYKRGSLSQNDPLMNIRSQYIHLMNVVREDRKVTAVQSGSKQQEKEVPLESKGEEEKDAVHGESEEKNDAGLNDLSGSEEEDISDDDYEEDDDDEEEEEDKQRRGYHKNAAIGRGRTVRKMNLERKGGRGSHDGGKLRRKHLGKASDDDVEDDVDEQGEHKHRKGAHSNTAMRRGGTITNWGSSDRGKSVGKYRGKASDDDSEDDDDDEEEDTHRGVASRNATISRGGTTRKMNFDRKGAWGSPERGNLAGKHRGKAGDDNDVEHEDWHRRGGHRNDTNSRERTTMNMNLDRKGAWEGPESGKFTGKHLGKPRERGPPNYSRRKEMQGEDNIRGNSDRKGAWGSLNSGKFTGKHLGKPRERLPPNYSRRKEMQGEDNVRGNSGERSNFTRNRRRSL